MCVTGRRAQGGEARRENLLELLSMDMLSVGTGATFAMWVTVCIVNICRVVFPGPECVPDRPVAGDVHVGSQFDTI